VLVEGNIFENCWADGQSGVAIVLKLGNLQDTKWNVTEDVVFRNNIVKNAVGGVTLQGRDYDAKQADGTTALDPGGLVRRLSFTNNVFEAISGKFLYLTHGPKQVTFDHNTIFNGSNLIDVDANAATWPDTGFKFTNNIGDHNSYGVFSSTGIGNATFNAYFTDPGHKFEKNVLVNVPYVYRNYYTARPNNYLLVEANVTPPPDRWPDVKMVDKAGGNYRLAADSPYKNVGTDGFDLGANIDLVAASTAGAVSGVWGNSFAYTSGPATLMVQFDGTSTPITLGTSGANITVARGATTLSFPGVTSIFVTGSSGDDVLQLDGAIAKPLTFSNENGNDGVRVLAGTQTINGDLASPIRNVTVTVDPGAAAVFNATQHLGALTVNGSATVAAGGDKVLITRSLTAGPGAKLDLKDNDMVLDYFNSGGPSPLGTWGGGAYSDLTGLIASGRNGGAWNGSGIVSSSAAGTSNLKSLGIAEATQTTSLTGSTVSPWFQSRIFSGEAVDDTAVLIKFTYGGDANLDGLLNVDDYGHVDTSIGLGLNGWFNGDFNFDGQINVDDYGVIDVNVGIQGAPL
jgi:hypothetical protein